MNIRRYFLFEGRIRNKNKRWVTLLFISGILIGFHLPAQEVQLTNPSQFKVTALGQEEGLAQNSVKSMLFDKQGFLWLATEDGLSRFDGKHFVTYRVKGSNRFVSLFKKNDDTLWTINQDNRIFRITNGQIDNGEAYHYRKHGLLLHNSNTIVQIDFSGQHEQPDMRQTTDIGPGAQWGFVLGNGFTAVENYRGVALYNDKGWCKDIAIPVTEDFRLVQHGNYILCLQDDNRYISVYDTSGFIKRLLLPFPLSSQVFLHEAPAGDGCYISSKSHLFKIELTARLDLKLTLLLDNFQDGSTTRKILIKDSNTIIAGSTIRGLYLYNKLHFNAVLQPLSISAVNNFYAQVLMPDNKTVLTGGNKLFSEKRYIGVLKGSKAYVNFRGILKDHDGYYWYAKPGSANEYFLYKGKYPARNEKLLGLLNNDPPTAFYEDSRNRVWMANMHRLGYFQHDAYTPVLIDSPDVNLTWIDQIVEDKEGNILIGTVKGLFFYNEKNRTLYSRFLKQVDVRFIKVDVNNNIWVATYGSGFYFINTHTNKVHQFPLDRNSYLSSVHCIIEDERQRFWLPTNHGIFVTTRKSLEDFCLDSTLKPFYYYYDKSSGLNTNEFNGGCQPSYLLHPDGYCTLPSIDGLVWFKPNEITPAFPDSSILIDRRETKKMKKNDTSGSTFYIDQKETDVAFHISSPNWINQENIILEYNISKNGTSQREWHRVNETQTITFSYLTPGHYKLTIRKRTGFNYNDYSSKTITIIVPPAWYQTTIFYLLITIMIASGIITYYKWRVKKLKRTSELLQQKIDEATDDLLKMNDELAKSNQVKNKIIGIFNHDISFPISIIHKELQRTVQSAETNPATKADLVSISDTMSQLQSLTDEILQWIKLQYYNSKFVAKNEPIAIVDLINRKWSQLEVPARQKQIRLECTLPDSMIFNTDKSITGIIIYNILSNVIKHNSNSFLLISLKQRQKKEEIIINFENRGDLLRDGTMHPSDKKNNHSSIPGFQSPGFENFEYGLGLTIIKDLAAVLDIAIETKNTGNRFAVYLKCPAKIVAAETQAF